MTVIATASQFRQFSAPRTHGTALVEPSWEQFAAIIQQNRARLDHSDTRLAGFSLAQLRSRARGRLVQTAVAYTRRYRQIPAAWNDLARQLSSFQSSAANAPAPFDSTLAPIIMSGHQPELFHPGVWFKNFALARLGEQHDALPINLIVDNDLCGAASVSVPTHDDHNTDAHIRDATHWRREAVAFDSPSPLPVPFEQRWVQDRSLFDSFSQRVQATLGDAIPNPCIHQLWPYAQEAIQQCGNLGCSLAQARHRLEADLGLQTLELPLSSLCRSPEFAAFILALLGELPRLHTCYNQSLFEYRAAHHIRSQAHPVPELSETDGWFEAPLWIYGDQDALRRPAWARLHQNALEISDRNGRTIRITAPLDTPAAVEQLTSSWDSDFKLRPRALITTMYARLVLSDLFLHGIGGAKYDQLGDMVTRRFFGINPPDYGVLSATALLPRRPDERSVRAPEDIQNDLRDTHFKPERFADRADLPPELLDRKRELLAEIPPRGHKADWHREITHLNEQLAHRLAPLRTTLERELSAAKAADRERQLWLSREHPFIIFPLDYLSHTFNALLPP